MSTTLRPSVDAFRRAGWLPVSQQAYDTWMEKMNTEISDDVKRMPGPGEHGTAERALPGPQLLQPVQEFKDFIETNPVVYLEFIRMFDGMTESVRIFYSLNIPSERRLYCSQKPTRRCFSCTT